MVAAALIIYVMVGLFTVFVISIEEDAIVGLVVGLLWPLIVTIGVLILAMIMIYETAVLPVIWWWQDNITNRPF